MARQLLLACLVAGLAVTALAQELCPSKSAYNGCRKRGCMSIASRRSSEESRLICDDCGTGYKLVSQGSIRAKCECAPGYAAKGNNGICKACPSDTDVAAGGSTLSSECLKCPEGSKPSRDKAECTCAAGHYRASVTNAEKGYAPVACKPCTARSAYITGNNHVSGSCSTCPRGQVANKAHTWCVDPSDADAATEGGSLPIPGLNISLANIQHAIQRGRDRSAESRLQRMEGDDQEPAGNPLNRLGKLVGGGAKSDSRDAQPPKLPSLKQVAKGLNATVAELRKHKPGDINLTEVAKTLAPGGNGTSLQNLGHAVTKLSERVASVLPSMPDPMYVAGMKLDSDQLADAGLPPAKNMAQLFGNLMKTTIGDLDDLTNDGGDWGR